MDLSAKHGLRAVHQITLENAPQYVFDKYNGYRIDIGEYSGSDGKSAIIVANVSRQRPIGEVWVCRPKEPMWILSPKNIYDLFRKNKTRVAARQCGGVDISRFLIEYLQYSFITEETKTRV